MKILCEYAKGNKDQRVVCTANNNTLCKLQRYCTMKHEWQNTDAFSSCERRLKNMARRKSDPIEIFGGERSDEFDNYYSIGETIVEEPVIDSEKNEEAKITEDAIEFVQPLHTIKNEAKKEKKEVIKEEKSEKRTGKIICLLGNQTIVETDKGNLTLEGRLGKVGRIIEF